MTFEIGLLLGLIVVCIVLFATDWVPADVVALSLLLMLIFTGLLPAKDAFAGFGSDTAMMTLGLLLMTAALMRTGVMDLVGGKILRFTGVSPSRLLIVLMLASALLGAFMSNTASTAFFVPVALGLAKRAKISPSFLLLPLAFSSILTSSVTVISTSTNIVISGLMTTYNLPPMGMFEMAPVGVPIALVGLAYMFFAARKWLSAPPNAQDVTETLRPFLSEILILPNSPLVGKTLAESNLGKDLDITVLRVVREKSRYLAPAADMTLEAGDVLLVEGRSEEILKIKDTAGIEIKADVKLSDPKLPTEDLGLVEALILPRSRLIGRTFKGIRFRERYGLQVLGINRHGQTLRQKISDIVLTMGDILLLQGPHDNLASLEEDNLARIIGTLHEKRPLRKRAPLAIGIFLLALGLATFKVVPLPVAVMTGAVLVFLTRCITPDQAYRDLEWKVIILMGSMLALGAAMEKTGAAKYFASMIVDLVGAYGPLALLSGFFFLTVALTQPMSNQAAAVVTLPIAIQTALQLQLNPRTFAMMVAVAASCSYLTPLEPSCIMVYGPGGYRFRDFFKIGSFLTVLIYLVAIFLVPRVWPVGRAL